MFEFLKDDIDEIIDNLKLRTERRDWQKRMLDFGFNIKFLLRAFVVNKSS